MFVNNSKTNSRYSRLLLEYIGTTTQSSIPFRNPPSPSASGGPLRQNLARRAATLGWLISNGTINHICFSTFRRPSRQPFSHRLPISGQNNTPTSPLLPLRYGSKTGWMHYYYSILKLLTSWCVAQYSSGTTSVNTPCKPHKPYYIIAFTNETRYTSPDPR